MSEVLSASQASARIRAGTLTCEAYMQTCLARIAAREPEVGAWIWLEAPGALAQAREADRHPPRGLLHGIPIGVKDIIDTADMPTGLGFAPYAPRRPVWDAACVAACRQAGAIILGKTVSTEFAYFAPGKTRNPHDLGASPGGSSSGSAAAVADAMVPLALGSQTAASLIRPAAFCGVVGYKASHNAFSLSGIRPFAQSLDSLGVLGRSVADVALMRRVLLGGPPTPEAGPMAGAPRLGFCRTGQWADMEPAARAALEQAVQRLGRAGAVIEEVALPGSFEPLLQAHRTIMAYEAARNYVYECGHFGAQVSASFRALCETGWAVTRGQYAAAQQQVGAARVDFARRFAGCEAWIAPSALGEAPRVEQGTGDPVMSRLWTVLQAPCLALPSGYGARGLPLGLQLVALPGEDDRLLQTGEWVAQHLN